MTDNVEDNASRRRRTLRGARAGAVAIAIVLSPALTRPAAVGGIEPTSPSPVPIMSDDPAPAPAQAGKPGWRPPLPGQLSSKFGIDEANPENSIPNAHDRDRNPLEYGYFIQDLLERADQAQKKKDYGTVIQYYRAVSKAVPESAKGWSKLCEAYDRVHDRERAIVACRYAIDRPGVEVQDYVRYVHLIIGKNDPLDARERTEIDAVLTHLDKQAGEELLASHLRCEVGVKASDVAMMETCTRVLTARAPDDPKTIVFRWSLAVMKGQTADANRLLTSARAAGIGRESIERMESVTPGSGDGGRTIGFTVGTVTVVLAAAAALGLGLRRRRALTSRATL
jgi:hypothetical protein